MVYRIGIDSGGTHITAEAVSLSGESLGTATAGPGNSLLDFGQTLSNLAGVITEILKKLRNEQCEFILAGVAGSQSAHNQDSIEKFIFEKFEIPTKVISDADLAILNGLGNQPGMLVIAGTGSIVLGQNGDQHYRSGGWGHLLGDEGGAYSIVRDCFKAMTKELEESESGSKEMTNLILTSLNYENANQAIQDFYRLSREAIAAKAKLLANNGQNNTKFKSVIQENAQQLAQQIKRQFKYFTNDTPIRIALTGSVLLNNTEFNQQLKSALRHNSNRLEFIDLKGSNAIGIRNYKTEGLK